MKWITIFVSVAVIIVLISMWLGYGTLTDSQGDVTNASDLGLGAKLLITFAGLILLIIGWVFFNYQKRKDEGIIKGGSMGGKTLSVGFKISGWNYRLKTIGKFVGAGLVFFFAIIFLIFGLAKGLGGFAILVSVVFLILAILYGINAWFYWKRSKSLVKGRYY